MVKKYIWLIILIIVALLVGGLLFVGCTQVSNVTTTTTTTSVSSSTSTTSPSSTTSTAATSTSVITVSTTSSTTTTTIPLPSQFLISGEVLQGVCTYSALAVILSATTELGDADLYIVDMDAGTFTASSFAYSLVTTEVGTYLVAAASPSGGAPEYLAVLGDSFMAPGLITFEAGDPLSWVQSAESMTMQVSP